LKKHQNVVPDMSYPINEIFYSFQGEATFAGTPSVFVRLQGCDVGCAFCDTKHTWTLEDSHIVSVSEVLAKEQDSPQYANFTENEILAEISKYAKCRHVVFTGGEPAQYNLKELIVSLEKLNYSVQIETSATEKLNVSAKTWVTVSPKIAMPGKKALVFESVMRADEIKMPVGRIEDIKKLKNFIQEYNISAKPIWLQPLSCNKKATELCVNAALENNWKVSLQIHKFLNIR